MLRDVTRMAFLSILEDQGVPFRFLKAENALYLTEIDSQVIFRSLDNPVRLVGTNLAWFAIDELTFTHEAAWNRLEARLRDPKASRLHGVAAWTPNGFDWVYRRFISPEKIKGYAAVLARPGENTALPDDFYERLKHSYDERFYKQEVLGEYLGLFAGAVYFAFDRQLNMGDVKFDPLAPLCWAMDFNVNPMASVLAQVIGGRVNVLEELMLPDSNTRESCAAFLDRAEKYWQAAQPTGWAQGTRPIQVVVYGDASGEQRNSAADRSDWQIVREFFKRNNDKYTATFKVPLSNPTIKSRVAAVNGVLQNANGERRLIVAPTCKELPVDLERVAWKEDAHGNTLPQIDKSDPKRTHVSDALGYLVDKEFGLRTPGGPRKEFIGV